MSSDSSGGPDSCSSDTVSVLLLFLLCLEERIEGVVNVELLGDVVEVVRRVASGFRLYLIASLPTSSLFEEPGWRGFALRELQGRFGREGGSIIVGTLWWTWHQPSNLTFGVEPTLYGFLQMVSISFMIDSLFNLSGRNHFTAMLATGCRL